MNNNRGHWEVDMLESNNPKSLWKNACEYFKWMLENKRDTFSNFLIPYEIVMNGLPDIFLNIINKRKR